MKKKIFVVVTSIMLLMSISFTTFAQPSVQGTPAVDIEEVVDKSNQDLSTLGCHEIRVQGLAGQELQAAQEIVKPENLKTVLTETEAKKDWTSFNFDAYLYDVVEKKEVEWEDGDYHFPLTITFKVPGIKPGDTVKVLHYYPDSWHQEQVVKVGNGEVTVTFAHLSPVVIMVDNPAPSGGGTPSSPQTGETNLVLYGVLMACITLTGVVVLKKKENA